MPNTKSAKKALRSSSRKREFNLEKKFKIKNALKEFRRALTVDTKAAQTALSKVFSVFDKAVKTNFIHKNRASRKKSRLTKMVSKMSTKEDK